MKPSADFGTGKRACLSRRSLWVSSPSSIDVQAESCPGVAVARKVSIVSHDMKRELDCGICSASLLDALGHVVHAEVGSILPVVDPRIA